MVKFGVAERFVWRCNGEKTEKDKESLCEEIHSVLTLTLPVIL